MSKRSLATLFLAVLCLTPGCVLVNETRAPTSIEIQSMQTREFDVPYKIAFASVVDVFQDLGFVIQSSDFATGLIIAKGSVINKNVGVLEAASGVHSKIVWNVGTAHLEEPSDGKVSIRVSFVANVKVTLAYGMSDESSRAILDGEFYARFFEKIDKSIFVRQNLKNRANTN
ncbi:MAG: hypothetical protein LBB17_03215 [Puniceicoccales bacterium]|jgi:hypothetical protein|nr:hypothetical protein [Puniceicoccales bacterium]